MPPYRRIFVLLIGLAGCGQDYSIKSKPDLEEEGSTSETVEIYPIGEGTLSAPWCPEDDELPRASAINEDCSKEVVTGTLDAVVEWELPRWSNYGEYSQIVMAPVVGQLDDDNGDGVVNRDDVPDIVVVTDDEGAHTHKKGILRIVPGDGMTGGRAVQRVDIDVDGTSYQVYPYRYSNVALGDVDDDGEAELVVIVQVFEGPGGEDGGSGMDTQVPDTAVPGGSDGGGTETGGSTTQPPIFPDLPPPPEGEDACFVAAFAPDLSIDWLALDAGISCGGHAPALADLEADGSPEVIVGSYILDGASGAVRSKGSAGVGAYRWHPETGYHPVPADLDGDGLMEVVTGRTIYDRSSNIICDTGSDEDDGYAAVADLNMDGVGEVVSVGNGMARVFGLDCVATAAWPLAGTGNGGPPTIADFDADGLPEIGIASGTRYAVYEPDGSLVWSAVVSDESSASTGSAVYDFEGDGQAEVVYADEATLWIFDGKEGSVRYQSSAHASRTLHEFPTIADVDGDGLPEVVVPNGGGHQGENKNGLWILGSANGDWLPARQVWNQHAYNLVNINDDLSIPAPARSNWPLHNNFRSGDPQPVSGGAAPDVVPFAELCLLECERNSLVIRVRMGNEGAVAMRRDVPVSIYAEDISGYRTYLGSAFTLGEVEPGGVTDGIVLRVDWTGYENQNLVVVADDEEGLPWVPECDETNNELFFETPACP